MLSWSELLLVMNKSIFNVSSDKLSSVNINPAERSSVFPIYYDNKKSQMKREKLFQLWILVNAKFTRRIFNVFVCWQIIESNEK